MDYWVLENIRGVYWFFYFFLNNGYFKFDEFYVIYIDVC